MFLEKIKIKLLSRLLFHANKGNKSQDFYKIKEIILAKYGKFEGYQVQFIEGKKCHTCGGTGIYEKYNWHSKEKYYEGCYHCFDGWYKPPVWVLLKIIRIGKYSFHKPVEKMFKDPSIYKENRIIGYVEHNYDKHAESARFILGIVYEQGFLKRWYKNTGGGWRLAWWLPRNYPNNIIHIIKYKRRAIPFERFSRRFFMKEIMAVTKTDIQNYNDLPF